MRSILTIAAVLSLTLCAATITLWVLSYCHPTPDPSFPNAPGTYTSASHLWLRSGRLGYGSVTWLVGGLEAWNMQSNRFAVPLWPGVVPILLMAVFGVAGRIRKRWPTGHCRSCGYDLRASTGRCPECGTAIPVKMNA